MFEGQFCRRYTATQDCAIQREIGTQSIDGFALHRLYDAGTAAQLDALAYQFLCLARRCKTSGSSAIAKQWKTYWRQATEMAAEARARVANIPSIHDKPSLFNPRTPGKPGCLDSDFHLPHYARIDIADLKIDGVFVGSYSPALVNGDMIKIGSSRHGKTWITWVGKEPAFEIATSTLRGLQQLGRLVPQLSNGIKHAA